MPAFKLDTAFYPLRLNAYTRSDVEMTVTIENIGEEPLWTECDVLVPPVLSLAPDKDLTKGRLRIGIIAPGEIKMKKCKIYATARAYPDIYSIRLIAYGYGRDGAISAREDKKCDLRCERLGPGI